MLSAQGTKLSAVQTKVGWGRQGQQERGGEAGDGLGAAPSPSAQGGGGQLSPSSGWLAGELQQPREGKGNAEIPVSSGALTQTH